MKQASLSKPSKPHLNHKHKHRPPHIYLPPHQLPIFLPATTQILSRHLYSKRDHRDQVLTSMYGRVQLRHHLLQATTRQRQQRRLLLLTTTVKRATSTPRPLTSKTTLLLHLSHRRHLARHHRLLQHQRHHQQINTRCRHARKIRYGNRTPNTTTRRSYQI